MPKAVKISNIECNVKSFSPLKRSENDSLVYCDLDIWIDVEFDDPVGESNFYSLSGGMQGYMPQFANFDIEDPIFKEYLNPLDVLYAENMGTNLFGVSPKFHHFADHSFDGKRKKFTLTRTNSAYAFYLDGRKSQKASINLYSETKESFDVMLSMWNYIFSYKKDLSELGLGGYIWLASNVSTSGGYVVSRSKDIQYVDVDRVVRKYYEEHYLK